ncbi:MAG: hypothetical protein ACI4II_07265 [Acutalibacteraceae bacterium]
MRNIMKKRIIPLLIAASLLTSLTACGGVRITGNSAGNNTTINDDGTKTVQTEKNVKITETAAKAAQTELYECSDFSITIPKGWKVTAGGINIYHSIRVYDPNEPVNQMFIQLKAEPLLHCEEGKAGWQYNCYTLGNAMYAVLADAPVMKNPSTEGFYQIQPQCIDNISRDTSYAGYTFPRFENFTVTERFASTSGMKAYALSDELLRATFTDNGKEGEGLFSASVVDFGATPVGTGRMNGYLLETVDGGYYMAYNIMAITAVKDTFIEWESLLTKCMKTIKYSDSFVNATTQASNEKVAQAMQFSQNANQIMDGMMSSWESRNKSQDIISQKQSDATLGYERIYDSETNEIYRATNGFSDVYDGNRYQPVTDDNMYTQPISGYIEYE